jgi:uncharacterized protein (TIGR02246 family)
MTIATRTDEQQIRDLAERSAAAMRAGDAAGMIAAFTPDAVTFTLAPPLVQDTAATHDQAGLQAWLDGHGGAVGLDVGELTVVVEGDLAFSYGLQRMYSQPDGQAFELWHRATTCYRRVEGEWRIVHQHTSTPFHMDGSFRAATDLKP